MSQIQNLLKQYLDYLEIEKNRSHKTQENYARYLKLFFKCANINSPSDITDASVRGFRLYLSGQNLQKVTQSYYVIAIRNFLKFLVKRDVKSLLPELIELPKIAKRDIEVLDYAELERLLKAPKGDDLRSLRDKAILETLFSTGLRLSELCSLNRRVDLIRGEVSIRGKGDKLRIVFLSDGAKTAIRVYLDKRTDAEEALFMSLSKNSKSKTKNSSQVLGRITPRAVQRLVDYYARSAGIPKKVHPHLFRHGFATDLLINGADIRSVQELLGHANIATTQIYTHLTNKELREIHQTFHARRRK